MLLRMQIYPDFRQFSRSQRWPCELAEITA